MATENVFFWRIPVKYNKKNYSQFWVNADDYTVTTTTTINKSLDWTNSYASLSTTEDAQIYIYQGFFPTNKNRIR